MRDLYYEASRICSTGDIRILLNGDDERNYATVVEVGDISKQDYKIVKKPYRTVVLGGTFDCLHNGHKVLLSAAILAASERIVCGVTYGEQNKKKCLWEMMQPLTVRSEAVRGFIKDVSHVRCDIEPIKDAFGPSTVDPNIEAIIVSQETVKGGQAVNNERMKKGLSKLDIKVIPLVEGRDDILLETKISSSSLRRARLGTLLHPIKFDKCRRSFIIGLSGGVGSGKTVVAKILSEKGCEIIDCDNLIQHLCSENEKLTKQLTDAFGCQLLNNGTVERKVLRQFALLNEGHMKEVQKILWPSLKSRIEITIANSNNNHIFIVASSLLEPRWRDLDPIHQIWCCIVPSEEAIKRIASRDDLSLKEAERLVELQLKNCERIQNSDVVICTLWDYNETERQITKALNTLKDLAQSNAT